MRHRAPTALSRLLDVDPRRGLAVGAVAALTASACVGLAVLDDPAAPGEERVSADPPVEQRAGTSYPGAAALETLAAERAASPADRGQLRTSPSAGVSTGTSSPGPATPTGHAPEADTDTPPRSAGPGRATDPTGPTGPTGPTSDPSDKGDDSATPSAASPSASSTASSPSTESSASPTPATAPETTVVTELATAGTWTVLLSSDQATSFECSLDGGAWTACGPVATFTGLSQGRHMLSARAIDAAGTADPTPAELSANLTGPVP